MLFTFRYLTGFCTVHYNTAGRYHLPYQVNTQFQPSGSGICEQGTHGPVCGVDDDGGQRRQSSWELKKMENMGVSEANACHALAAN